jgi:hypothetical protein
LLLALRSQSRSASTLAHDRQFDEGQAVPVEVLVLNLHPGLGIHEVQIVVGPPGPLCSINFKYRRTQEKM